MKGRYYKLFAIANELNLDLDALRDGAAQITGKPSLRSLSNQQLAQYIANLGRHLTQQRQYIRRNIVARFERNELLSEDQVKFLIDLISQTFKTMPAFRQWLNNYHHISSERFLTSKDGTRIIKVLTEMRARRFTT